MSSWSEDGTNYLQQLATCLSVLSMSSYDSSNSNAFPAFCSGDRYWICRLIKREQENDKRLEARINSMQQWLDFTTRLM